MINEFKDRIKNLETAARTAKEEQIRLEANLEQATAKRAEIKKEIEAKGYTVETISDVINEKSGQLSEVLEKLDAMLPGAQDAKDGVVF